MLVLFESAVGFSLFKLADGGKLEDKNLHKEFESPESANNLSVALSNTFHAVPSSTHAGSEIGKKINHQALEGDNRIAGLENAGECITGGCKAIAGLLECTAS